MKKVKLSLNFAIFGLSLASKNEKMFEIMEKFPGLIRACSMEVISYLDDIGLLDESKDIVAKIGRNLDYSNCANETEKVATFITGLCNALKVDLNESKEGD